MVTLAGLAPAAYATGAEAGPGSGITHPFDDFMGSTVAAHEPAPMDLPLDSADEDVTGDAVGIDVSHYQGAVDWTAVAAAGASFGYLKATEGTGFVDPMFAANYTGSAGAGLVRGAYHFALPDRSSGAAQATYFLAHGGGWTADGDTLPPVIDIEYNPYGSNICYGLSQPQMTAWLTDFANTVHARINRWPVIYSTTNWWTSCTGGTDALARCPLWIARYNTTVGALPDGWADYTFWQHADAAPNLPGDQDYFNGTPAELHAFALDQDSGDLVDLP